MFQKLEGKERMWKLQLHFKCVKYLMQVTQMKKYNCAVLFTIDKFSKPVLSVNKNGRKTVTK